MGEVLRPYKKWMVKLYAHWRPTADTVVKRRGDASMVRTFVMRRISALVLLAAPHFLLRPHMV